MGHSQIKFKISVFEELAFFSFFKNQLTISKELKKKKSVDVHCEKDPEFC